MDDQNLFLRNDTILGVCEAIGRDFGFHPNWLRVGFAVAIFFAPFAVIAGYVALAVPIAAARWMYPAKAKAPSESVEPAETATTVAQDEEEAPLPLAA
jgi:phage shock protein PspC (stress-responsive transcriptional regulator)